MIAASAAASKRWNQAARSANEPAAIATIPEASESIPSIRLTRLASASHEKTGSGQAAVTAGPVVPVVDAADPRSEAHDEGRQQEHEVRSRQEPPDRRRVTNQRVHRVREGHCSRLYQSGLQELSSGADTGSSKTGC